MVIRSELRSKTVVALGDPHICLHSILNEFVARRALIGDQRPIQRSQALTLSASHLALMFEDVESLWLVITEETWEDYNVGHVPAPIPRVAISTQPITVLLDVNIG